MKTPKHIHLVIKTSRLLCTTCGDSIPFPLGSGDWVHDVMKLFGKHHTLGKTNGKSAYCIFKGRGNTYFQDDPPLSDTTVQEALKTQVEQANKAVVKNPRLALTDRQRYALPPS